MPPARAPAQARGRRRRRVLPARLQEGQHVAPWSAGRPCRRPRSAAGSSLFSSISLRTAGDSGSRRGSRFRRLWARSCGLRRCGRGRRLCGRRGLRLPAPSPITPSTAPTSTVLAVGDADLAQRSGRRREHLERHLVGLQLHQRLVGLDRGRPRSSSIRHRRFGDGFAQGGNDDIAAMTDSLLEFRRLVAADIAWSYETVKASSTSSLLLDGGAAGRSPAMPPRPADIGGRLLLLLDVGEHPLDLRRARRSSPPCSAALPGTRPPRPAGPRASSRQRLVGNG